MTTLETILDQLYYSATDERDKGDKFERLMLQFFKTDLLWSARFADVWMWADWPERHGRKDNGIDLVTTDRETGDAVASSGRRPTWAGGRALCGGRRT